MNFVLTHQAAQTVEAWLASRRAREWGDRVDVHSYEKLALGRTVPTGTWVFTDMERLGPARAALARRLWDRLEKSGHPVRLLNHPDRALARYEVLERFHDLGWNRFRAYRLAELDGDEPRFPVFVREERAHTGSLTGLLRDRDALERAVERLVSPLRGYLRSELLVVEFSDTSDEAGRFLKYSAFRVGERIVPRYLEISDVWIVKNRVRRYDERSMRLDREYVVENPHREQLLRAFELAGIEYGRIDYSMLDGVPQVWEINTAPTIGPRWNSRRRARAPRPPMAVRTADLFHAGFRAALHDLETDRTEGRVRFAPGIGRGAAALLETARRLSLRGYRRLLKGVRGAGRRLLRRIRDPRGQRLPNTSSA